MADLQAALAEAVKLNQHITQFLKFSTYPEYNDLSGLDIDFHDGEQILIWDELRRITERLADVQEYKSLTWSVNGILLGEWPIHFRT